MTEYFDTHHKYPFLSELPTNVKEVYPYPDGCGVVLVGAKQDEHGNYCMTMVSNRYDQGYRQYRSMRELLGLGEFDPHRAILTPRGT